MARRIAITSLNASTIDIINTIRANASAEYQQLVPEIEDINEVPRVGEVLYGYPALANQFITSLVNRIALVRVKSATFNNAYAKLKKGYLEFGETVEEVFVGLARAREFSAEKAEKREFKRTIPDVKTAFHAINWQVQYPITIQNEDLRQAFTSINGVEDLIAKIINSVYTAAEYDEFLLFKYLLIKAIAHGKMYAQAVDTSNMNSTAVAFRGLSNKLIFMSPTYNSYGVHTTTPKANQYIFMDADFNAQFDVEVLARAFNMEKADFMGRLELIDNWASFDNDRWAEIREECDGIEEVTAEELTLMKDVKAVLLDEEWFQVYDNLAIFTEKYVASGLYWNYFYTTKKTVSYSPFSNAIVFVNSANPNAVELPENLTVEILDKNIGETTGTIFTLSIDTEEASFANTDAIFEQTEDATTKGIAIHKYGAVIFPVTATSTTLSLTIKGVKYTATTELTTGNTTGDVLTFNKA